MFRASLAILLATVSLHTIASAQAPQQVQPRPVDRPLGGTLPQNPPQPSRTPGQQFFGTLTEDIVSNSRRGALVSNLLDLVDSPETGTRFTGTTVVMDNMRTSANNGWLGDFMIGTLAARGLSRDVPNPTPNQPSYDAVRVITARMVDATFSTSRPQNYVIAPDIEPIPLTAPRMCVTAFADAIMNMESWLAASPNPQLRTLEPRIADSRARSPDADLMQDVSACLMNRPVPSSPGVDAVAVCATVCGGMGLRHAHDTGLRYNGRHMTTPPRAETATGSGR